MSKFIEVKDMKFLPAYDGLKIELGSEERPEVKEALLEVKEILDEESGEALIPEKIAKEKIEWALYQLPPFGKMIWEGKKTLIVKNVKLAKHIKEPLLLCSGEYAYGVVVLEMPIEIDLEEFKKLEDKHCISEKLRQQLWPEDKKLYAYDFKFERLEKIMKFKKVKGFQSFIRASKIKFIKEGLDLEDWILNYELIPDEIQETRIKGITAEELSKLSRRELIFLHARLHQLWGKFFAEKKEEKLSRETLVNTHFFVIQEFKRREPPINHNIHDELDRLSEALEKEKLKKEAFRIELIEKGLSENFIDALEKTQGDLMDTEDYICFVGSAANKPDRDPNDIDLLVRGEIEQRTKIKIERVLKEAGFTGELHWFRDDKGPHSSYYPVYSHILRREPFEKKEIEEDRYKDEEKTLIGIDITDGPHAEDRIIEESQSKLQLMKPFQPLKPSEYASRFFDIDELIKFWAIEERLKEGLAVDQKFDGLRTILQRDGDKTLIYFEDAKKDRSENLPNLVKDLKSLPIDKLILDGELLEIKDGEQTDRKDLLKFAIGKGEQDDSHVEVHCFDCLWYGEKGALNELPWKERQEYLKKGLSKNTKHIKRVISKIVHTREDLKKAMLEVAKIKGSEGAMVKISTSRYSLGGRTVDWTKIKSWKTINYLVYDRKATKTSGVYNYLCAIRPSGDIERFADIIEFGGKKYISVGSTYNVKEDIKLGTIIEVAVAEIKITEKDGKIRITHDNPVWRGSEVGKKEPYTFDQIKEIAEAKRGFKKSEDEIAISDIAEKEEAVDKTSYIYGRELLQIFDNSGEFTQEWIDYEAGINSCEVLEFDSPTFEEWIEEIIPLEPSIELIKKLTGEEGGAARGKGNPYLVPNLKGVPYVVHIHWRGLSEEEAKTGKISEGRSVHLDLRWKSTPDYGLGVTLDTPGSSGQRNKFTEPKRGERILCQLKNLIPMGWFNSKNFPYISEPGGVGATSLKWARIEILKRGNLIYLPYKDHFLEFLFEGKERWCLMFVPTPPQWTKVGKAKRIWLLYKPEDQEPYWKKHPEAMERIRDRIKEK